MCIIHSIQDGDTITIIGQVPGDQLHRIRLADLDAPEHGEPFWKQARLEIAKLAQHHPPRIEAPTAKQRPRDPYNRYVAYVWFGDTLANAHLCGLGLAALWLPFGPSQHSWLIEAATEGAKAQRLGIWSLDTHRLQTPPARWKKD